MLSESATGRSLDRAARAWCTRRRSRITQQLQDIDVYASGPPAMVEAVRHEFVDARLPPQQLFFDSFDYAPDALAHLGASSAPR